jgi:integrase
VDRYLDFVAGRCRPNTLRAVTFDLKAFFAVTGKDPVEITAADVFDFLGHQRGDRTVVRLADRESGLSARGDTPVQVNPVPRGLLTRRQGGSVRSRTVPLVRVPRTLPRILPPQEAGRLVAALRTHRDRAMVLAMLLAGLRRCEVLGLRFEDVQVADRRLAVVEGKGGHHRVVPAAGRFFEALGDYLHDERPATAATDRVFVVLKGPRRGMPLSAEGLDEILDGARGRAGLEHATCHELRHTCLTRLREAGMALEAVQAQAGHRSIESTRVYLHLANDWLAGEHRRAVGTDPGRGAADSGGNGALSAAAGHLPRPGQCRGRGERAAAAGPLDDHRCRAGQHRRGAPR